ncbi:MAG: hypothetical protein COA45_08255 [Zetaproteobacteria bacterium]|nr:MAG: hypothetical protein COA45_08255 [Zetaproteobacteria bacterium]
MTTKQDIAKELVDAWSTKNEAIVRKYLHADFHFKGPMMESNGLEECIASMANCPFESSCQNSEMIEQGDQVVHVFDWVVTAPFQATIPTVEVMKFEGDQVKKSRMFFDTALFPVEFLEQMKQQAA